MNKFTLQGRVGSIEMEYLESGSVKTTVSLGVADGKDPEGKTKYENYFITFFNSKKQQIAELLGDSVKDGDYIRVEGRLRQNKFTPQGSDKPVYRMQLLGWGFKKVAWDKTLNKFIDLD